MKSNFPRAIFAEKNNFVQQIEHILSEAEEVRELLELYKSGDESVLDRLFEECSDLRHSAETLTEIEPVRCAIADQYVIEKNLERGYYTHEYFRYYHRQQMRYTIALARGETRAKGDGIQKGMQP